MVTEDPGADDDPRRERAIELRAQGWTLEEIKKELRVGSTKVGEWLSGRPSGPRARRPSRPWSERRRLAHERRLRGETYRQIESELGIPRSTLSSWFRDLPLSDEQRAHLSERRIGATRSRAAAIRASRIRRTEEIHSTAAAEVGSLTDRELFLLGVALYWAEGSKAKPWAVSTGVAFINSDPQMITLFLAWLRLIGVAREALVFGLSIHESADVEAATSFWAALAGVPASSFRRASLKRHNPHSVRHNTGEAYVGCLIVAVRRSTNLNRRIEGWWKGISAEIRDNRS